MMNMFIHQHRDLFFLSDSMWVFDGALQSIQWMCSVDLEWKISHAQYIYFILFVAEDQFKVQVTNVPNNSKLPLDVLRMHIHRQKFCLTNGAPPKVLAIWQISDLRKFGVVDKKFIFEGGSNCGKGKSSAKSVGFFFLLSLSLLKCFST